jgi:hypothetical protein
VAAAAPVTAAARETVAATILLAGRTRRRSRPPLKREREATGQARMLLHLKPHPPATTELGIRTASRTKARDGATARGHAAVASPSGAPASAAATAAAASARRCTWRRRWRSPRLRKLLRLCQRQQVLAVLTCAWQAWLRLLVLQWLQRRENFRLHEFWPCQRGWERAPAARTWQSRRRASPSHRKRRERG